MKHSTNNSDSRAIKVEAMIDDPEFHSGIWEKDPIWDVLKKSEPFQASEGFVDRVTSAIRAEERQIVPFWTTSRKYVAAIMAAAACVLAYVKISPSAENTLTPITANGTVDSMPASETFADLDEEANQEMLLAAVDHLSDFSDTELVTLIGL